MREQRHPDPPVEPLLPAHVRAEPGNEPEGAQLEDPTDRLVALAQHVDLADHLLRGGRVEAAHGRGVDVGERVQPEVDVVLGRLDRPDLGHVRHDLDAEGVQEGLGQRAARDPRGGLTRGRPLEHVADVGEAELLRAREVGVAGTREVDLRHVGLDRPRVHPLLPVLEVAVGDLERDGAAERAAVADARRDLRGVLLDLHPAAAPVAQLAPGHVAVDRLLVEFEACGEALHDRGEARSV